ncbi:MAG: type III pantothenate kinase [Candidatus Kapaibacterium sp.]|nr:type III pantothenate kinase [Ignavibacteriota bacterium]MCB9221316.1 type III pantothenate kinase [Ignavibacteria bacterium]
MSYSNILIADIGNSRVKFKSNHEIIAFDYFTDELNHFLNNFKKESAQVFYYSSVNKDAEKFIVENLEHKIETIENAHSLINYQNPIDFTNIKGMGTDRMLSLLAVEKVTDSPLVTVDCGTAVTVNLLDEDNICLGGVIFPGFYTQSKALHNFTSNLPLIESINLDGYCGQNTDDAIRFGILNTIVGGIKTTIDHSSFSSVPDVFVTGGYGHIIKQRLLNYYPCVIYDEDLVIKGIEKLIKKSVKI